MTAPAAPLTPDFSAIDAEHRLQVSLVAALEDALKQGDGPLAGRILENMTDLAQAHFLSEELLMRLHQYGRFQEHVAEHAFLVEELRDLARRHGAGELGRGLEIAVRLRTSLVAHIQGPDRALAQALGREGSVGGDFDGFRI
jgi:hemerythrin-like metal-binding protein